MRSTRLFSPKPSVATAAWSSTAPSPKTDELLNTRTNILYRKVSLGSHGYVFILIDEQPKVSDYTIIFRKRKIHICALMILRVD